MSLLTDTSINDLLATNKGQWQQNETTRKEKLLITNFNAECLTPVGYDLRVGSQYLKMYRKIKEFAELGENGELVISPKEIVAIETEEFIGMPQSKEYSGILVSKVSVGEKGLSHISTSLDADWRGKLLITTTNHSNRKVTLKRKQPFCTMILFKNESRATKECGKHPDTHVTSLIREWKLIERIPRRMIYFWILKISIPAIPLVLLLINYLSRGAPTAETRGVSSAEVALFVAFSSSLFVILDRLLRTE